jgi:apolipoprotein D and lipocalin family protein
MKFVVLLIIITSVNLMAQQNPPTTVNYVDLNKYAGLWYEIAKIPNSFQDHCVKGTTAKYTLTKDGEIEVINSCIDEDGEIDNADGVARIVDKKTNAKLEVSFVSFLGWRPFWGDYWIIGLDQNYQWAIVGTPNRKYGWVLSRTPHLSKETMDEIFQLLKVQGYNPIDFQISIQ